MRPERSKRPHSTILALDVTLEITDREKEGYDNYRNKIKYRPSSKKKLEILQRINSKFWEFYFFIRTNILCLMRCKIRKKGKNEIWIISKRVKFVFFSWKYNLLLYVVINLNTIKAKVSKIRDRTSYTEYRSMVRLLRRRGHPNGRRGRVILAEKCARLWWTINQI